ncbi:MAG: hypothetical protein DSM107014_02540 [Gomphosphaeria aponina SAG 52.96 = DSM 107014]|uniref:Uncharacterized protein n=1 Tax=Gomphosphaeria aponina SAG 52.96 = DSM 107014 TaxID=1521640 RepID=A0A941GNN5_9CHRO|nr:hypothetical protein [Gomphosphaeria aponina SAG 52.96 = DSM 107014]
MCNFLTALASFPQSELKESLFNFCQIQDEEKKLESQGGEQLLLKRLKYQDKKLKAYLNATLYLICKNAVKCKNPNLIDEYESLLGKVVAESLRVICINLELNAERTLEENLSTWLCEIRRFRYQWLDIVTAARRRREDRLFDVLEETVSQNEAGFTLDEFYNQAQIRNNQSQADITREDAEEFLNKQVRKIRGTIIPRETGIKIYQFPPNIKKLTFQQELKKNIKATSSTNTPVGENGEEEYGDIILGNEQNFWQVLDKVTREKTEEALTIEQRILDWVRNDPENELRDTYPKGYPDCNCHVLINHHNSEKVNLSELQRELGVRQNLSNYCDRTCFPLVYEKILAFYSPNILAKKDNDINPEYARQDDIFRSYIQDDLEFKLRNCFTLNKNGEKFNAQTLTRYMLPIFRQQRAMTAIAQEYGFTNDKLNYFWKKEVLMLLSKIVIEELEADCKITEEIRTGGN